MNRIAIVAAMPGELASFVRGCPRQAREGVDFWRGRRGAGEWFAACAGVGASAAARAFAAAEGDGRIDAVVSVGWAGALREEIAPGRVYAVSGVVDARTGERFPVAGSAGNCWLVTDSLVADRAGKRRLAERHGAALVDMEAAAVARLAGQRGIPFHCFKGVSDGWREPLPDFGAFLSPDGKFQTRRFILYALLRPRTWPALVRIGAQSRAAARGIGHSLRAFLETDS